MSEGVRTVYLGQFEHDRAERLAGSLERAGIAWSFKMPSRITQFFFAGEWGVRLFVDAERLDEARAIAVGLDDEEKDPDGSNP